MQDKKTSVVSIRVPERVKETLENESDLNNITLNANVAKILQKHVDWHMYMPDTNFVYASKEFIKNILDNVKDETVKKIALDICLDQFKDSIEFMQGELTKETLLKTLDNYLSSSNLPFRKIIIDNKQRYIINHSMGKKWSLYFDLVFSALCDEVGFKTIGKKSDSQTVSFTLEPV